MKIKDIRRRVDDGAYKIPDMQRDYSWNTSKAIKLLESISKGIPIGSITSWNTSIETPFKSNGLGGFTPKLPTTKYILDGQQRFTTLYYLTAGYDNEKLKTTKITVDVNPFGIVEFGNEGKYKLTEVFSDFRTDASGTIFITKYGVVIYTAINNIFEYDVNEMVLDTDDINLATETFVRINEGGVKLHEFDILKAIVYDIDFNLEEEYESFKKKKLNGLISNHKNKLFQSAVLSMHLFKSMGKDSLYKLKKSDFQKNLPKVNASITNAINAVNTVMGINISQNIIRLDTYILLSAMYMNDKTSLSNDKLIKKIVLLWSITTHFSSATSPKLAVLYSDYLKGNLEKSIDKIYRTKSIVIGEDNMINNLSYGSKSNNIRLQLVISSMNKPVKLKTLHNISSDDWQVHHIFPKNTIITDGYDATEINSIGNLMIIDGEDNREWLNMKPSTAISTHGYKTKEIFGEKYHDMLIKNDLTIIEKRNKDVVDHLNDLYNIPKAGK